MSTEQAERLELFDAMAARLHSAVVSDILDALGHRIHTMEPALSCLDRDAVVVGWANPFLVEEVDEPPGRAYEGEIAALDDLRPGEVPCLAAGGSDRAALWGELFSTAALARGARGLVADGYVRDRKAILGLGFPVFSRGGRPLDCHGRTSVRSHRQPATVGGVRVEPGDVVFADLDGVVVIPAALLVETATRALEKVATESNVRRMLTEGRTLREAFDAHGVL